MAADGVAEDPATGSDGMAATLARRSIGNRAAAPYLVG
jgi:hypothetical protein